MVYIAAGFYSELFTRLHHQEPSPGVRTEHWDVNIYPDYTHSFNINTHSMDGYGSSSSSVLSGNINQRYMSSASLQEEEEVASDNIFSGCTPSCPLASFNVQSRLASPFINAQNKRTSRVTPVIFYGLPNGPIKP